MQSQKLHRDNNLWAPKHATNKLSILITKSMISENWIIWTWEAAKETCKLQTFPGITRRKTTQTLSSPHNRGPNSVQPDKSDKRRQSGDFCHFAGLLMVETRISPTDSPVFHIKILLIYPHNYNFLIFQTKYQNQISNIIFCCKCLFELPSRNNTINW